MTPADLRQASPRSVAELCGLTISGHGGGGIYCGPCPECHKHRAHARKGSQDKRGALWIGPAGTWFCHGCGTEGARGQGSGGVLDLLCLCRIGRRWDTLTRTERDLVLDAPPPPIRLETTPPPKRITPDLWREICNESWSARRDDGCVAWARRRGLPLTPDLLALPKEPVEGLPFWSLPPENPPEHWRPCWLPGVGYRLLFPMTDHTGEIVAGRLRNTRREARPDQKERGIPGHDATGCVYADRATRLLWASGRKAGPTAVAEGGPDRLAAWKLFGASRSVLGFVSGSFSGRPWGKPWAPWIDLLGEDVMLCHQVDARDSNGKQKGQEYAAQFLSYCPQAVPRLPAEVYAEHGREWSEGMDLAELLRPSERL